MRNFSSIKSIGLVVALFLLFISTSHLVMAEGTKQIRPTSSDHGYMVLDAGWSQFALYDCDTTSRFHIRICNVGEKIYYGFRQTTNDVKYRIKDPDGNIVVAESTLPSSGNGRIDSHAEALVGPKPVGGASGYDALVHTATKTGDYYIEFKNPGSRRTFDLFDVTVATSGNVAIPGRIWSQAWMFSTDSYTNKFKGKLYIYSDDQIVTGLEFNNMQPYVFVVSANETGTQNTGDAIEDRKSRSGLSTYPQYKIFMNDPDLSCFPTGSFGSLTGPVTITGCGTTRCINIPVDLAGDILVLLDLNGVSGYQPGTTDRQYAATVVPGNNCIEWDTKDGQGNLVPGGTTIDLQIDYLNGITHLPLYDVEYHTNGYKVTLVRPTRPDDPQLFWDDSAIPSGTTEFSGCTSPCHTWSWGGSDNKAVDYGNRNTINTWWYGNIIKTDVTYDVDLVVVDANRNNPPAAANDTTICNNTTSLQLAGLVSGFTTTGIWSTTTGGTFSSATNLDATYTFTAAEKTVGNVIKLALTSTNNGSCPGAADTLTIRFVAGPTVSASSQSACENNPIITLNGAITVATGAEWTGGNGTFNPNRTTLNAKYTPTAAELTAGFVNLTLTTTGNGICTAASTPIIQLTYDEAPTVEAGNPISKCANNAVATLAGTVSGHDSFVWSGGSGTFSDVNSLTSTYTPTDNEKFVAKQVTLTLTAVKSGCVNVIDQVTITYTDSPTISAGFDASACANNPNITLAGTMTGPTAANWVGGAGTFSPNRTTLNAVYTPTASEITSGVTLTLTSTAQGSCSAVSASVDLSWTSSPTITLPTDVTNICSSAKATIANNTITGATGVTWTGNGGTFTPGNTVIGAGQSFTYAPSAAEITAGVAALIVETTGNGSCLPVKDTFRIFIAPAPTVEAGPAKVVCANSPMVALSGSSTGSPSLAWSGGSGTFSNVASATSNYTLHPDEVAAKTVTLTLTGTKGGCVTVTDQVTITVSDAPTVAAGADQTLCKNNAVANLNGSMTVATAANWVGGTGTFTPNRTTLNATYTPTEAEKGTGVTLTLTTTSQGTCTAVSESMNISYTDAPVVDAGNPQSACSNNPTITLTGLVSGPTTTGEWTGGTGTFSPNRTTLNAIYTPTNAEKTSGVTLTLTSTSNGNCTAVTDQVALSWTSSPTVSAGGNQTICENNATVTLNGTKSIATSAVWTGGNGTFAPDNTTLNATYTPSADEIIAGTVTLTLTTTGNGNCNAENASTTITISDAPTVDAGQNQTVCGNTNNVDLDGEVTVATSGTWTTTGTGSFAPNSPAGKYKPSAADVTAGFVDLTLTSTDNGNCVAVDGQIRVFFTQAPTIYAGPDQEVCTNEYPVQLAATGSAATWSGGTGTFSSTADMNATYTPSAAEETAGEVELTATTIAAGACPSKSSKVTITILPKPIPDAGGDQTVCGNTTSINLNGDVDNATGGFWTTTGDGSFNPNAATISASYVPSDEERENGATITNTITSTPNSPCPAEDAQMTLTIVPEVIVFAGPDQEVCASVTTLNLTGLVENSTGGTWSIVAGNGTIADPSSLTTTYNVVDADTTAGSVTLRLTSTATANCAAFTSDITFTFIPVAKATAANDFSVCATSASVNITGSIANSTGASWTSNGTGTFSPSNSGANVTYFPSAADTTEGTVTFTLTAAGTGTCASHQDQVILTIDPKPVVLAGDDISLCKDVTSVTLNGKLFNVASGTWSTSGTGTFDNITLLGATYTPSAADKNGGTVTLTLTSDAGTCASVEDKLIITFTDVPVVNAGPADITVCADVASVPLNGTVTNATGGIWTTNGSGSFTPNNTTLNASYDPSDADTTAGTVILTLTSTGNGTCINNYQDIITVTITKKPLVEAGLPATICADSAYVALGGSFAHSVGAVWSSSGSGTFFPNASTMNANYVPSGADKTTGSVTLTITSDGNGSCNPVTDTRVITITPGPTATAGDDQTICAETTSINIVGDVTIATIGKWTTSGSGTFGDPNAKATSYTPSANDKASGTAILTFTTVDNGNCKAASDPLTLKINPIPVVNPGANQTVCADITEVNLNGTVTNATGGKWTTSGTGVFDNENSKITKYYPSAADKTAGTVTLTLTSTGNGLCTAVSNSITLLITPAPTLTVGNSQTICASGSAALTGTINPLVSAGGKWTSTGSGTFSPSATTLNATYLPSAADKTAGTVTLTLTTTGSGTCAEISKNTTITITPVQAVDAGSSPIEVCADVEHVQLDATITNSTGGTWSTDGSGDFADASITDAIYSPSAADLANGTVTLTLTTIAGTCSSASDNVVINFSEIPTVTVGPDIEVCPATTAVGMNPSFTGATGGSWITTGTGTFDNEFATNATYNPMGEPGPVLLIFETSGTGACNPVKDTLQLTFSALPSIDAGPATITVCKSDLPIQLSGTGTTGVWSQGAGTFSPNANTLNATYMPTQAEKTGGTVTLRLTNTAGCGGGFDEVTINITTDSTGVFAGNDIQACANGTNIALTGTASGATGVVWTTNSGTGTFANSTSLNTTFTPSPQQVQAGVANLTLTTTGTVGGCKPKSDQLQIIIGPAPTVDAGAPQNVCASVATVQLAATKTIATGVQWTIIDGDGSLDNSTIDNPVYTLHANDRTAGFVTFEVETTGNGVNCNSVKDQVTITFTGNPTADAGADSDHCADASSIALTGISSTGTATWSTNGDGTFSPNTSTLNANYIPGTNDKTGTATLTLTTTGNGACAAATATRILTFSAPPTVGAGDDQEFCSDEISTLLAGTKGNSVGISWSSTGTGTFSSTTDLLATYTPSTQDKLNGGVNLTLITTGNAPCAEIEDFVSLVILPAPTSLVNAGFDQEVCRDVTSIQLSGEITIAGGGKWTTNGSGSFLPTDSTLDAEYIPSTTDKDNGSVIITLTSTGNGICNQATDDMTVTFTPSTTANIANVAAVCETVSSIALNGTYTVATGVKWTTSGSGTFAPNEFTEDPSYFPSAADIANGSVGVTMTTTGNGTCNAASKSISITFQKKPVITLGDDKELCSDVTSFTISSLVTNTSGVTWSTSGDGFIVSENAFTTSYFPSAAEIASTRINLFLTANGQGSCGPVMEMLTVDFTPAPTVNIGPEETICADLTTFQLNGQITVATGAIWTTNGTGSFNPNSTTLNAIYVPSQDDKDNGLVTLTLTTTGNGLCNAVSGTKDLNITKIPIVSSGDPFLCAYLDGATLTGDVDFATGGIWTSTGSGTFSPSATDLNAIYFPSQADVTAGIVTVTLTSTGMGTCNPVSSSSIIRIKPLPVADAGNSQYICRNANVTLVALPADDIRYQWTNNAGAGIGTGESVTVSVPNDTYVVLSVTDTDGCITRDTVNLTAYDLPTLTLPAHACLSDSLVLDCQPVFSTPTVPGDFQWFRNNLLMSGENDFTLVVKNTGTHTVKWSYGNIGCQVTASTNVTAPPVLVSVDTVTACENSAATLTTVSSPATGVNFEWTFNAANAGNTQTISTAALASGISTYYVKGTDALGCYNIDSVKVQGIPVPQFDIKDSTNCEGIEITFDGTPTNIPGLATLDPVYQWKNNTVVLPETSNLLTVNSEGTYIVIVTIDQCVGDDTAEVVLNPNPTDGMTSGTYYCEDTKDSLLLNAGAGAGLTFEWQDANGAILGTNQTQQIYEPGEYFVTITNTFNCTLTDSIEVRDICEPRVFIPTGFSPDGKGHTKNEQWEIENNYVKNWKLTIFSRWGEIVFYTEDPNEFWDGYYRGEPMPIGVYPYIITYEGEAEEFKGPFKLEGAVTIVR